MAYHHGDLRAVLLSQARGRLESGRADLLSMREMAKEAGVSHTAAYRHFQDRDALMQAVALEGFEEMRAALQARKAQVPAADARAGLKAIGLAYVAFGLKHPRLLEHMFGVVSRTHAGSELAAAGAHAFEPLLELITAGQSEGRFRAGEARALARACWAMVHGLCTLMAAGALQYTESHDNFDPARLDDAARALDVFLDGLCAASGA